MSFIESFINALLGVEESENGPCSECRHKSGFQCLRFYDEEYSRVDGTTRIYDFCEKARSSDGFCGYRGKYWESIVESSASSEGDGNYNHNH